MKTKDQRYYEELVKLDQEHSARLVALRLNRLAEEMCRLQTERKAQARLLVVWQKMPNNETAAKKAVQILNQIKEIDLQLAEYGSRKS